MGDNNIHQWLQQARAKGLSDMEIKVKLKEQGWDNNQINEVISPGSLKSNVQTSQNLSYKKSDTDIEYTPRNHTIGSNIFKRTFADVKRACVPYLAFLIIGLIISVSLFFVITNVNIYIGTIISFLVIWTVFPFIGFGAVTILTSDTRDLGEIFSNTLKRLIPYLYTSFLSSLVITGGFFLFVIPGILMSLAFVSLPFVVAKENLSGFAALKRCYILARNFRGNIFGTLLMLSLFFIIIFALIFGLITLIFIITPENTSNVATWLIGFGVMFISLVTV
ncbi:hypothetical protein KKF61_08540, partial [Patescibacteria group bacterium]|nr:hypothetical protein [Patescibacteria group bacterium]